MLGWFGFRNFCKKTTLFNILSFSNFYVCEQLRDILSFTSVSRDELGAAIHIELQLFYTELPYRERSTLGRITLVLTVHELILTVADANLHAYRSVFMTRILVLFPSKCVFFSWISICMLYQKFLVLA